MERVKFQIGLVVVVLVVVGLVFLGQERSGGTAEPVILDETEIENGFGQLPLLFVENQGQWDEQVAYAVQGSDKTLYFTGEGVTFALDGPEVEEVGVEDGRPDFFRRNLSRKANRSERWVVKLDFVGANPDVVPVGEMGDSAVVSYFKGEQEDWHTGLPTYRRIVYYDLWPGIDLVYEGTVNKLKYHFVVAPGADPNLVQLAYRGASGVSVNEKGQLVVETPLGGFEDDTPIAYQEIDGERVLVDMAYALGAETAESQAFHFDIGKYDSERPLILDPVILVYSGFVGGTGEEEIYGIDLDVEGNAYITGLSSSNESTFPVTVGPDLTHNGDYDVIVVKVNPTGTELIYAGYIGGSDFDLGTGIKVDSDGNSYIVGETLSDETTFPVLVGPDLTHNGFYDTFVVKVNPAGTELIYAGYIGGSEYDGATQLDVDGAGNVFVTGQTDSDENSFPVIVGPDLTFNGTGIYGDAFVSKVNAAGTGLIYSGYIGGNDIDAGVGIVIDSNGNAYVVGGTASSEATFPVLSGPDLSYGGNGDGFITKISPDGSQLIFSGYIGGDGEDNALRIALDDLDNIYIAGDTGSDENTFPVIGGPDLTFNGYWDAYVAKLAPNGIDLIYSGYIGGSDLEYSTGIAVGEEGSVYIGGVTESDESTFPVILGPDLIFNGGMDDGFITKIQPDGLGLDYSGFIGGAGSDGVFHIAVDTDNSVYLVGYTSSDENTFPIKSGPDLTYNGGEDGFIAKFSEVFAPQSVYMPVVLKP